MESLDRNNEEVRLWSFGLLEMQPLAYSLEKALFSQGRKRMKVPQT